MIEEFLWAGVIGLYVIGDTVTTYAGFKLGASEKNIVISKAEKKYSPEVAVLVTLALKIPSLSICLLFSLTPVYFYYTVLSVGWIIGFIVVASNVSVIIRQIRTGAN